MNTDGAGGEARMNDADGDQDFDNTIEEKDLQNISYKDEKDSIGILEVKESAQPR